MPASCQRARAGSVHEKRFDLSKISGGNGRRVDTPRKPRYMTLAEEIEGAIGDGRYAVGALLPSESELCERYRVSRHTVREATRVLQDLGLGVADAGLGTRIQSARTPARYVLAMDAIPDLWEYVKNTELKVVRRKLIRAREALTQLPVEDAEHWRLIEAVRTRVPRADRMEAGVYRCALRRDRGRYR
jgi:DNA-binding GntR family transcriptional regulator